ncbi:50S ribosomal protein L17 [Blattabacterium cuenoti]|uniref:50S ribosomal protein L17 n=1 Tax=Blattabacterium cuenoti TaxID=1653831 RepID=UPI00311ED7DD
MNHRNKNNHLGRKRGHRKSLLSNMASSLIKKKRIFTTLAKAKALRKYIEPIITKSKIDTTHSKRNIFSYLKDKTAVSELFKDIFQKTRERPGGYTRIIKTGFRFGDQASFSLIELVDFNEIYDSKKRKKPVRRSKKKIKKMNNE